MRRDDRGALVETLAHAIDEARDIDPLERLKVPGALLDAEHLDERLDELLEMIDRVAHLREIGPLLLARGRAEPLLDELEIAAERGERPREFVPHDEPGGIEQPAVPRELAPEHGELLLGVQDDAIESRVLFGLRRVSHGCASGPGDQPSDSTFCAGSFDFRRSRTTTLPTIPFPYCLSSEAISFTWA